MICTNCRGKKVFKDLSCYCVPSDQNAPPKPDCSRCQGKGSYDSTCPLCNGKGEIRDSFNFVFVNDDNGQATRMALDVINLPTPKLASERQNSSFPHLIDRRWDLPLEEVFKEALVKIGAFEKTHFMYRNGRATEWWEIVRNITAGYNGAGHDPDPTPEELMQRARVAFASHFGWYSKNGEPIICRFKWRKPTEELLEDLYQVVSLEGYAFEILTGEGIIATGETGWSVWITHEEGGLILAEIGLAYELHVALRQALDSAPEAIEKIRKKRV